MAQVRGRSGKSIITHEKRMESIVGAGASVSSSFSGSRIRDTFSTTHSFKGNIRIAGNFMHVEYLWLMFVEFLMSVFIWSLALNSNFSQASPLSDVLLFSLLSIVSMVAMGLYDNRQRNRYLGMFTRISVAAVFSGVFIYLIESAYLDTPVAILSVTAPSLVLVLLFSCSRAVFDRYVDGCVLRKRILVLGTGKRATKIEKLRRKSDQRGFELLGFVASKGCQHCYVSGDKLLDVKDFCGYALENNVDEVVVALDDRRHGLPTEQLLDCRMSGIEITEDLDFFERESGLIQLDLIKASWLIHTRGFSNNYYRYLEKRALDILGAVFLGVILAPLMALTALMIKFESGARSSIWYTQKRIGRGGIPFTIYKFRSMCSDAEKSGEAQWASTNDQRVTKVGKVIRKYRLDETPQLWNVLRGDMSLVGPRPERPEFVENLNEVNSLYRERHRLAPGLTGWAQLCYPYGASTDDSIEKLKYDLYYVKNQGLFLDLFILMQTAEVVLFNKGAR